MQFSSVFKGRPIGFALPEGEMHLTKSFEDGSGRQTPSARELPVFDRSVSFPADLRCRTPSTDWSEKNGRSKGFTARLQR
jgi:hypothetical protein